MLVLRPEDCQQVLWKRPFWGIEGGIGCDRGHSEACPRNRTSGRSGCGCFSDTCGLTGNEPPLTVLVDINAGHTNKVLDRMIVCLGLHSRIASDNGGIAVDSNAGVVVVQL